MVREVIEAEPDQATPWADIVQASPDAVDRLCRIAPAVVQVLSMGVRKDRAAEQKFVKFPPFGWLSLRTEQKKKGQRDQPKWSQYQEFF